MEANSPRNPLLTEFRSAFHRTTGLPLEFHSPGKYAVTESPGIPDFCRVMSMHRKVCESCTKSHLALQDSASLQVKTARCFAGLTSSAVPVIQGDKSIGFLHTGHVYVDRAPGCSQPGRGCMLPGRASRRCGCSGACRETPKFETDRYEGALGLLRVFASQLAGTVVPGSNASPYSTIEHVIHQIRADVARDWRLRDLALSAGMHPGYFSEQFHRHTGRTLTDFLASLRVDRARHLLEFTALPISEVAFASGFRSISQFNRVFKTRTKFAPLALRKARCPHAVKP